LYPNAGWSSWKTVVDSENIGEYALTSLPAHTHTIDNVTGLQTALDGKQASLGFTPYNATNPSGYITSYVDTVTSVGIVDDLSTGDIVLKGDGATTITKSGGTITITSTDTNTNTTYSAGTGLTLTGTTFSVTSGTYAAASHNHDDRYYTETESDSRYLRSDIYNSNYGGLQVFRNIGTNDGSWPDADHTFGLENNDAGNIVINFHRSGYTSNNLRYNGTSFRFDLALESTGVITASGGNSTNWNTAYGWGNHSGLYLGLNSKAADSELIDGIDSSSILWGNARGTNDSLTTDADGLLITGCTYSILSCTITTPTTKNKLVTIHTMTVCGLEQKVETLGVLGRLFLPVKTLENIL
jgi:hypothetical protein